MSITEASSKTFEKTADQLAAMGDKFTVSMAQLQAPLREAHKEFTDLGEAVEVKRTELEDLHSKEELLTTIDDLKILVANTTGTLVRRQAEVDHDVAAYKRQVFAKVDSDRIETERAATDADHNLDVREREVAEREAVAETAIERATIKANNQQAAILRAKEAEFKLESEGVKVRCEMLEANNAKLNDELSTLRTQVATMATASIEAASGQRALAAAQNMAGAGAGKRG